MRCIAVDDEPRALEIINSYCNKVDFIDLVSTFRSPLDAMDFLLHHEVDLIFLDINMPDISGTEFVRILNQTPMIIFTTAYSEFAIVSYDLNALDYLLKPFDFDRFVKSVIKAKELLKAKAGIVEKAPASLSPVNDSIQIKSGSETFQVKIENIQYVEGLGNYINVYQSDRKITCYISLQNFFEKLPKDLFARIHKSFIVSIIHIRSFENHQVKLDDKTLPIGKLYRKSFIDLMKNRTSGA